MTKHASPTKVYAIRCACGERCGRWLARARLPRNDRVSFPILGVFLFYKRNRRLTFTTKFVAEAVVAAVKTVKPEQKLKIVLVIDDRVPGRLQGKSQ